MEPIIQVKGLSKRYQLGEAGKMYGNLREALVGMMRGSLGRKKTEAEVGSNSFWALRNVSMDIARGDTVGIIGSNGAGKSTMLKILSRIVDPTEGQIRVRGSLASLLEVGTGFHPELTGRENIFLNGAILGMRKSEIDAKFDAIVEFSGVEAFLDTPVKRYSSGMYVRLAFAIAAHLEPDILIVDEVLAVGDVAFQRKCLGKMAEARAKARTVIFVSHNLSAVEALCNRAVVLHRGTIVFDGTAKEASDYYMRTLTSKPPSHGSHVFDLSPAPGRPPACPEILKRLELYTWEGEPLIGEIPVGGRLKAVLTFELERPTEDADAWIAFDTLNGARVCTAHSAYQPNRGREMRKGEQTYVCEISDLPLVPGEYRISAGVDIGLQEVDWVEGVSHLTVVRSDYYGTGVVPTKGSFLVQNRWNLNGKEVVANR